MLDGQAYIPRMSTQYQVDAATCQLQIANGDPVDEMRQLWVVKPNLCLVGEKVKPSMDFSVKNTAPAAQAWGEQATG